MEKYVNKKIILLIIGIFLILVALVVKNLFGGATKSTLSIEATPADATVKIDGKTITNKITTLKPDSYIINVEKNGYITQNKTLKIKENENITVQIKLLKKNVDNTAINELRKYFSENGLYQSSGSDLIVKSAKAFYDDSWIIGIAQIGKDPSIVILNRPNGSNQYVILMGPGKFADYFDDDSSSELPMEVFNEGRRLLSEL